MGKRSFLKNSELAVWVLMCQLHPRTEESKRRVLHLGKTLNFVISGCRFAEEGVEVCRDVWRTCRVLVLLLHKRFPLKRFRASLFKFRNRKCFVKLPILDFWILAFEYSTQSNYYPVVTSLTPKRNCESFHWHCWYWLDCLTFLLQYGTLCYVLYSHASRQLNQVCTRTCFVSGTWSVIVRWRLSLENDCCW